MIANDTRQAIQKTAMTMMTTMMMTMTGTTTIRKSIEFVQHIGPAPARQALRNNLAPRD